ncbi:MAG: ATP-dependent endonuclease [Phycisphaerae bacterium]|nr:ATP-dependent endonuclease [Phycisphaerae bacterium]
MRIRRVHITNFRCLADATIDFEALTALVGPNGSGKSAVVRAIRAFYDSTLTISPDDFYNRDEGRDIEIAITFADLSPKEKRLFYPYIDRDSLTVTKVIRGSGFRYHGTRLQHPGFAALRQLPGKRDRLNAYGQVRQQSGYSELPSVKSADQADEALSAWEDAHPDQCEMMCDDGQFWGFWQVGKSRLERFTRYVFVPAVRDAEQDATDARGSAIYELMELVVRSVLAQNEAFQKFKQRVQEEYAGLITPEAIPQLGQLGEQLTAILRQYVPSAGVMLQWLEAGELSLPTPKTGVRLQEDGFVAPVDRVGHGLQRAFILSLLQQLVAATAIADAGSEDKDEVECEGEHESPGMPDLILGIEEPELYQHPNRQRHLARILWDLAQGTITGVARRTQVIYSTHSPLFVDLQRFDSIRRLSKVRAKEGENLPLVTRVTSRPLSSVAKDLEAAQDEGTRVAFTAGSLRARMATLMTPWMNEGFFADVVVLVEGEDDRAAILGTALFMNQDLAALGVAVIPCMGKDSIDRPYLVFSGLNLPVYVVFDGDHGDGAPTNRRLQRLLGLSNVVDAPPDQITATYAIFAGDLDGALYTAAGQECYTSVATKFTQEYGYPDLQRCKKSPLVVATLLKEAHHRGIDIPDPKAIVASICDLLPGCHQPAHVP